LGALEPTGLPRGRDRGPGREGGDPGEVGLAVAGDPIVGRPGRGEPRPLAGGEEVAEPTSSEAVNSVVFASNPRLPSSPRRNRSIDSSRSASLSKPIQVDPLGSTHCSSGYNRLTVPRVDSKAVANRSSASWSRRSNSRVSNWRKMPRSMLLASSTGKQPRGAGTVAMGLASRGSSPGRLAGSSYPSR